MSRPIRQVPEIEGILSVSAEEIDKLIQSDKPTMVEFYTDTCGSCHQFTQTLHEAAKRLGDQVQMVRVEMTGDHVVGSARNVLARRYNISGHPTTMFFHQGEVVSKVVGASEMMYFQQAMAGVLGDYASRGVAIKF